MTKFDYVLDYSPNGRSFYALYKLAGSSRQFVQNLSALYPKAVVKAFFIARGKPIQNLIPMNKRVFLGESLERTERNAPVSCHFTFGKYSGQTVKCILRIDPQYVNWFFMNVNPFDKDGGFWEAVVDTMAWICWYQPNRLTSFRDGKLFKCFKGKTKKRQPKQVTNHLPYRNMDWECDQALRFDNAMDKWESAGVA